jgi:hypothetical protein
MCFAAVSALWVSSVAGAHDKECSSPRLVGTWMLAVTPEPNPEVPVVPPAFTALFQFETAGTISETDGGFHPTSTVDLFPDLGSLSSSDGIGAWEAERGDRYRGQFIKNLFDATGKHIGFVVTRISITLLDADRLEATSTSDFVLGADWTAEPFFAGGVTRATGTRVRAH